MSPFFKTPFNSYVLLISTLSSSAYAQSVPITQIMVAITVADKNPDLISFHMFDKYRLESICPETKEENVRNQNLLWKDIYKGAEPCLLLYYFLFH